MSDTIVFSVEGTLLLQPPRATLRGPSAAAAALPTGRTKACVQPGAPRRGRAEVHTLHAQPGQDLVVLHLQDGPALVLHPEHARDLLRSQQGSPVRAGAGEVNVPGELAWPGSATRGIGGGAVGKVLLKAIELLTGVAADPAADLIATQVVQRVDGQVEAGVYRLGAATLPKLKGSGQRLDSLPDAAPGAPVLVLVHGTFVDTASTFGKLWLQPDGAVQQLFAHYGERVYALDHPTLGSSPIGNALTLVRALPTGTVLHLLTHSRGGLVAEVLVRAAALAAGPGLDALELAAWADVDDQHYGTQRDELQALVRELALRRVRVERVVRVACPAHGTLLASKRLDAYLSVLQWTLQLAQVPVLPALVDLLGEVARRRADPTLVPGLEAMMPGRALVRWLQRPLPAGAALPGALRAVAGEVQGGDGVLSWVKALLADALYWTDNDIVVHTASMFGGTPRPNGQALFMRAAGADATHFDYFHTGRTAQAVLQALVQDQPGGFAPIGAASAAGRDSGGLRGRSAPGAWHLVDSVPADAGTTTNMAAARDGPVPLQLGVVNGNLQFVRHALLVGHYRSLKLSGTEAVMDRLLGGVMHRALQAGLYAEAPQTHRIFTNLTLDPHRPRRAPRPAAVVVVGLGDEGALRGDDIIASVRQAVLAQALREAEQQPGQRCFTLASTLLGSGGTGVSPGAAAQAVAMGVLAANQRLRQVGWPVVERLEFVELFLDRATEAWQALQVLGETLPQCYALEDTIEGGLGCLRRPLQAGYRGAGNDLVSAVAAPGATSQRLDGQDTPIEFVLCTRRARNEVRALAPQATLVRQMVATAARDGQADTQIGRSLFQLLVPAELEPFLAGSQQLVLEVDDSTAGIPWELLDPRRLDEPDEAAPWALRCRLLRKLRSTAAAPTRPASRQDAPVLVIGEPLCDRPGYPPLPGARAEAEAVAQSMSQYQGDVEHLDGAEALQVIHALMARDWRALHLAGHGLYDREGGGMVLSGGCLLGPREIQAMRTVPELVFVNCCHLGREDPTQVLHNALGAQRPLFAATVARQLIDNGVRCVVACGWAVSDTAALAFATTFYATLLKGQRFIDAVGAARTAAWTAEPGHNTWAAYQCYGDPDWTWCSAPAPATADTAQDWPLPDGLVSPAELCLQLEALAVQSQYGEAVPLARIAPFEALAARRWPGIGAVWEALGVAYAEAGALVDAVRCHAAAVTAEDASASLRAAEQWGNLMARTAAQTVAGPKRPGAAALRDARTAIQQAQERLTGLVQLQPTVERLGLLASVCKRRLLVEAAAGDDTAARAAFDTMRARYAEAAALADRLGLPPQQSLRARQHAACCAVWTAPARLRQLLPPLRRELEAAQADDPDFWTFAGLAELLLLEGLADGRAADALPGVLEAYTDLHLRMPAPRLWHTVEDQLRFLTATQHLQAEAARRQDRALPALLQTVSAWTAG